MKKYSFKDILEKEILIEENKYIVFEKIEIPMIQRDYAQGRENESDVRNRFLDAIFESLTSEKELDLDFVYGSISESNKTFIPLDGQQRLTTLFLLYFYIGSKELKNNEEFARLMGLLKKFTYETRVSSRRFCEKIVKTKLGFKKDPKEEITNLSWFFKSYKKDPTVNSMLNMLNAIDERYTELGRCDLFEKLNKLQFNILPLNGFNLSEELYVKMNARGKQLTDFENFKADITKWMKDEYNLFKLDFQKIVYYNNREMPYYLLLSQKIDNDWTSFFWNITKEYNIEEKDKKGNLIFPDGKIVDPLFLRFFYRYFLNKYIIYSKSDSKIIDKEKDYQVFNKEEKYQNVNQFRKVLSGFVSKAKILTEDTIVKGHLNEIFQNINDENLEFKFDFDKSSFFLQLNIDEQNLISQLRQQSLPTGNILIAFEKCFDKITANWDNIFIAIQPSWPISNKWSFYDKTFTQSDRIIFLGIILFFENNSFNEIMIKQWMRIVWNIVENTDISDANAMIGVMKLITELAQYSSNIYAFLGDDSNQIYSSSSKISVTEERNKSKFIIHDSNWEIIFINAEKHPFFRGSVGFLMTPEMTISVFSNRTALAIKVFDSKGVNEEYRKNGHLFLRALISRFTDRSLINQNFTDTDEGEHYLKKMLSSNETIRNATREWFSLENEPKLKEYLNFEVNKESQIQGWSTYDSYEKSRIKQAHESLYKTPGLQKWMQQNEAIRFAWNGWHLWISRPRSWYDWIMLDTKRNDLVAEILKIGFTTEHQVGYSMDDQYHKIDYFRGGNILVLGKINNYEVRLTFDNDKTLTVEVLLLGEWGKIKAYDYNDENLNLLDTLNTEIFNNENFDKVINAEKIEIIEE